MPVQDLSYIPNHQTISYLP